MIHLLCLFQHPTDVDYRVMATFTEVYTTLLGFVNFRLYHSLNLTYPPKVYLYPRHGCLSKFQECIYIYPTAELLLNSAFTSISTNCVILGWLRHHYSVTFLFSFKIDIKTESQLNEDDEDYAMNSESYLEVSLLAS